MEGSCLCGMLVLLSRVIMIGAGVGTIIGPLQKLLVDGWVRMLPVRLAFNWCIIGVACSIGCASVTVDVHVPFRERFRI